RWAKRFGEQSYVTRHADRFVALVPAAGFPRRRGIVHDVSGSGQSLFVEPLEACEANNRLIEARSELAAEERRILNELAAVALAHAAFPVPAAEGSRLPELGEILADLGDEQSVDRGLSTFAAHLVRLRIMAERAAPDTLVLCDELGAGTDPEEGAALARALVERFCARGAWGVVTTHLGSLKRAAGEVAGIASGSLAFDPVRLQPLYRFQPGIPGASHALAVAEQLGVPEEVIARARALTPETVRALERLLAELEEARRRAEEESGLAREAARLASQAALEHREAAEAARVRVAEVARRLTRESEAVLGHAGELWQTVQRDARRAEKRRDQAEAGRAGIEAVEREVEELRRAGHEALEAFGGVPAGAPPRLEAGARVRDRDLGVEAEFVSGPDREGRVLLRRGSWSIRSHVSRLEDAGSARSGRAPGAGPAG